MLVYRKTTLLFDFHFFCTHEKLQTCQHSADFTDGRQIGVQGRKALLENDKRPYYEERKYVVC